MKAQRKKSPAQKPAHSPGTRNGTSRDPKVRFAIIITGLFFLISVIGLFNHEMWRDELQAWLVARDAHSLPGLVQNLKYEGNPMLWHLLLFFITIFTHDPAWMQVLHLLISCSFVFLLNRFSPFSLLEKILMTFGYYSLFEFNLISRSYGLGFLLVVAICVLYKNRHHHYLLLSILLFLLANTHVFGLIFSICFSGLLLADYILNVRNKKLKHIGLPKLIFYSLLITTGWILSVAQILPSSDNTFPVNYPDPATQDLFHRFLAAFTRIVPSYFSIPKLTTLHFWNTDFFGAVSIKAGESLSASATLNVILSLFVLLIFSLNFLRKPLILVLYLLGTCVFIYFFYYSMLLFSRYISHLFVLLVVSIWLSNYYEEIKLKNLLLDRWARIGKTGGKYLFIIMLFVSFLGGAGSFYKDLQLPFSASSKLMVFLQRNQLEKEEIVAAPDWGVLSVAALLDRQCYYPFRDGYGSFVVFDNKRSEKVTISQMIAQIEKLNKKGSKKILFILSFPLTYNADDNTIRNIEETMITQNLHLQLVNQIPSGIVADELYYIYLVEEKPVA